MSDLNLVVRDDYVFRRRAPFEVADYVASLAENSDLPDAFFCSSDNLASTVITSLQSHGVRVPDEVSVAGFGNLSSGRFVVPSVTTIDESHPKVAWRCVEKIIAALVERDFGGFRESISPSLIFRESVGPA